jgi:hypothetical protein
MKTVFSSEVGCNKLSLQKTHFLYSASSTASFISSYFSQFPGAIVALFDLFFLV